jgi:hypothetical protein
MFYSMGNLLGNRHVGMPFINFEKRIGCGYKALLASATTIHCCRNMPRRN